MKQQLDILDKIVQELKADTTVSGVMVMGSVADGTANEFSDLDIMILCNRDKFEAKFIDGILVEYIYMQYETALYKLNNINMEVYRYIYSKVIYDSGKLEELMTLALNRYNSYRISAEIKKELYYWLISLRIKLKSAIDKQDALRLNYLTSAGSLKLIEAIWAANNKPLPPSGSLIKFLGELTLIPDELWFEKLFSGKDSDRTDHMLGNIDWVLPKLKTK